MSQSRKTTFKERVEIVHYCIVNDHNYGRTAIKYQVLGILVTKFKKIDYLAREKVYRSHWTFMKNSQEKSPYYNRRRQKGIGNDL